MNSKEELLRLLDGKAKLKCAIIANYDYDDCDRDTYGGEKYILLKVGYSESEYIEFLNKLDFDYYSGFGIQELFGELWFADGTWAVRGEYDGSEWWSHRSLPAIPNELN
jgi:hypothetical protein